MTAALRARIERAFVPDELAALAWDGADAVAADTERIEQSAERPAAALASMVARFGEAGLLRLVVPAKHGGALDTPSSIALCLARERLAYASPLADLAFAMQGLGSYPITLRGSSELAARHLPAVARGEVVAAFALTEPDAGSDLGGIATTARRDGNSYVLSGEKIFISNAPIAGLFTVFAATAARGEKRRLSAFAVPAGTPGLRVEPTEVLGGHPIGRVLFDGVRVPEDARIGDEGDGMQIALGTLHRFRPTVGAAAVGLATRALDEAARHVKTRAQFGAPLATLQAVQLRIADMACDVDSSRLLVYRAAATLDRDEARGEAARQGSMAKLVATESAQRVIDHAVQLFGGRGVEAGSVVARLYEDVRALRIYEGTTDVQKMLVAREVLGT